jgi:iron complex transport system substrate-binding protein
MLQRFSFFYSHWRCAATLMLVAWLTAMLAVAPSIAQSPSSDNGAPDGEAMRIVSLGGSITETVYALGAGPSVVGVDASSL